MHTLMILDLQLTSYSDVVYYVLADDDMMSLSTCDCAGVQGGDCHFCNPG